MRRFMLLLPMLFLLACGDDDPDALRGVFDLTELDGQPLPGPVTIDGVDYRVTAAAVQLHTGNLFSWSMLIEPVAGGAGSAVTLSDFFRRVRADSLAFPGGAEEGAEFFGSVDGGTLTIVTIPSDLGTTSFAEQVGGEHTWTFEVRGNPPLRRSSRP